MSGELRCDVGIWLLLEHRIYQGHSSDVILCVLSDDLRFGPGRHHVTFVFLLKLHFGRGWAGGGERGVSPNTFSFPEGFRQEEPLAFCSNAWRHHGS